MISDSNGCITTDTVTITTPSQLVVSSVGIDETYCGASDGAVTITQTGGTGLFQYSIDCTNFSSSPTFTGLTAGLYNICVLDTNGCQGTDTVTIACSGTTGVDRKTANQKKIVRLNPTLDKLEIDLGAVYKEIALNVYSTTGHRVLAIVYRNQQHLYLNLEDLASGMYLAHIQTPNSFEVIRLVKGK